jgi:flagellar capping protein FliD
VQSRKAAAYAKIATAKYNGQKRTFTFNNSVEVHQGAHNTQLVLNESVPETTKKVTDFLAGITDPHLSNTMDLILGDAQRLQDFESCQQL